MNAYLIDYADGERELRRRREKREAREARKELRPPLADTLMTCVFTAFGVATAALLGVVLAATLTTF